MDKERRESVEKILKEEGNRYQEKLRGLQRILRDVKEKDFDGYLSKEVKKYINRKKVEGDIRLCMQVIADVTGILLAINEEDINGLALLGGMYDGEIYPEILEILKKAGLEYNKDEEYVKLF